MFVASKQFDLAVASIPKSGITSIRGWLRPNFVNASIEEAMEYGTRVAFIRHPIERLKSCYSFYYWCKWYGTNKLDHIPTDSWESFVDHVIDNQEVDHHWTPQVVFTGDAPNIWHRFENIGEHWEKYYPGILSHENRTTRLDTTDHRMTDLLKIYAQDLSRWEAAT